MAASDELLTFTTAHQIDLTRVANQQTEELLRGPFARADRQISRILLDLDDPGALSGAQRRSVEQRIVAALATQNEAVRAATASYTADLVASEVETVQAALARALRGTGIDILPTPSERALALVRRTPMLGLTPAQWLVGAFRGDRDRVIQAFRQGLADGLSPTDIRNAVIGTPSLGRRDGVRQVSRNALGMTNQTLTTHTNAITSSAVYETNERVVEDERWVAMLDGKTSPLCRGLDGKVFPVGEGRFPPAHPNCRSGRIPILKGLEALPTAEGQFLPSSVADRLDGQPPKALTYGDWLRQRSERFQIQVLGPTRHRLWRTGNVSMDRFVNDRGRLLSIPELRQRMPEVFAEAFGVDRTAISARIAARLTGPKATQITSDLDRLYEMAAEADPILQRTVRELANELNGEAVFPPGLKGRARVIEKANAKYGGDFAGITDLSRATLKFESLDDLYRSLDALEDKGLKIVRFNDRFANPTAEGYSDIILGVEMPNGHVAELQLHIPSVLDAKEANHILYEEQRSIFAAAKNAGRDLSPAEAARVDELVTQQQAAYREALAQAD